VEALDKEQSPEVQAAIVGALGRMPTDESIARLTRVAEPGGLLRRKPTALRIQAVEALREAATAPATEVLRGLTNDRDSSVREAATRALNGSS
jgi:HEAT repeat protein